MEILIHFREISIYLMKIFGNFKENRMRRCPIIVRVVFAQPMEISIHCREIRNHLMEISIHCGVISISLRKIFDNFKENRMRPCPNIVRAVFAGAMEIYIHYREITNHIMVISIHFR